MNINKKTIYNENGKKPEDDENVIVSDDQGRTDNGYMDDPTINTVRRGDQDNKAYDYAEEGIVSKNAYIATDKKQDDDYGYQVYEERSESASSPAVVDVEGLYANQMISKEVHVHNETSRKAASELQMNENIYSNDQVSSEKCNNYENAQSNDNINVNQLLLKDCSTYEHLNEKGNDIEVHVPRAKKVIAFPPDSVYINHVKELNAINTTTVNIEKVETVIITFVNFPNVKHGKNDRHIERDKKSKSWNK